ncbi:MAG: TlpA family protein disulfide reductase [Lewinellaceae bacterium]|nr:TlpA family protein disulfide reductase [Lewinellaceae bacterium]
MHFRLHLPALLIALPVFSGCTAQSIPAITGHITLQPEWKPVLYLVQPRGFSEIAANFTGLVVDSAGIAPDGRFTFSNVRIPEGKTLFQICIQKQAGRFPNQLLDEDIASANYMPVVLQPGETLEIVAEAARFQATFSIKNPSAENAGLLRLRDLRQEAFAQNLTHPDGDIHEESLLLEHEDALLRFRRPLMAFADTCPNLLPALVAVRWVSPAGDYERVPEFVVGQCRKWSKETASSPWVRQLCATGNRENLPVLTGDVVPDYPLPMVGGDTIRLHALLGSRLTILDIWASWCAPCRRENREILAPLWVKYNAQGLQIIGYSIDGSAGPWKAAIAKDGAVWPHAGHLSGDSTPFLETLRITTIPANFILDARGNVVAKNLHGAALEAFVATYF